MFPPGTKKRGLRRFGRWTIAGVVAAVAAGHLLVFWLVCGMRPLPVCRRIPPPNFNAVEAKSVDPESGETVVYREFTVSTKLADDARAPSERP